MKKLFFIVAISIIITSCGGVIGNIEMTPFDCGVDKLQNCYDKIYEQDKFIKNDNNYYKDNDLGKVSFYVSEKDTFVIGYELTGVLGEDNSKKSMITFIDFASKKGDVMHFESGLTRKDKKNFYEVYNFILSELKKCGCKSY